jgi:hypothetical protein
MKLAKVKRVISGQLGELPLKENGGTFRPSSYKRETQNAETHENIGFTESPVGAELKLTLQSTMDPSLFRNVTDDTLTIFLDGGGQHVMPRAWLTDPPELGNGEIQVTYNSGKSEKLA